MSWVLTKRTEKFEHLLHLFSYLIVCSVRFLGFYSLYWYLFTIKCLILLRRIIYKCFCTYKTRPTKLVVSCKMWTVFHQRTSVYKQLNQRSYDFVDQMHITFRHGLACTRKISRLHVYSFWYLCVILNLGSWIVLIFEISKHSGLFFCFSCFLFSFLLIGQQWFQTLGL